MTERIDRLMEADHIHRQSLDLFDQTKTAFYAVVQRGRKLIRTSRNVIIANVGESSPTLLATAGLVGSLAVPRNYGALFLVMDGMKNYLTKHPGHENPLLHVTAADFVELIAEFQLCRCAVHEQKGEVRRLMNDRDAKAKLVRKDMQTVLAELRLKVDPLSEAYDKLGFKRPGLQATPDAPGNLAVSNGISETPEVRWERPPRARYYHVWIKVIGVDEEFRLAGTRRNRDMLFKDLPRNAELEVAVSALNSGGESARSATVTFKSSK
jgi:hypothetical protein